MRILIINRFFCELSAGESLAWKTYQYLKDQGHDVFFFATDRQPYFIENYEFSKFFPKDRFSTIEYLKNPISYYWDIEAMTKLELMLEYVKPDIVHVNQPITMSIFSTLRKHKIPVVWTLHDSAIVCGTSLKMGNKGFCEKFLCKNGNYINCFRKKCKDNKFEPSFRKMILGYVNYFFNSYDCVDKFITPSIALKNIVLSSSLKLNKNKFIVLNNFVETTQKLQEKNLDKNSYFLYIGRLVEEKGIQIILEAAKDLPREIQFLIVGKGEYEIQLKKLCKQYGLNNITFKGYVSYDNVDELYQNAIATIVPTLCFEAFGMINIESFANKTPVIGSMVGGIPEIIEENSNGFLFEPTNIEKLKEIILTYWNNLNLSKLHGINGYNKVLKYYNSNLYFKKLEITYKEILGYEN